MGEPEPVPDRTGVSTLKPDAEPTITRKLVPVLDENWEPTGGMEIKRSQSRPTISKKCQPGDVVRCTMTVNGVEADFYEWTAVARTGMRPQVDMRVEVSDDVDVRNFDEYIGLEPEPFEL